MEMVENVAKKCEQKTLHFKLWICTAGKKGGGFYWTHCCMYFLFTFYLWTVRMHESLLSQFFYDFSHTKNVEHLAIWIFMTKGYGNSHFEWSEGQRLWGCEYHMPLLISFVWNNNDKLQPTAFKLLFGYKADGKVWKNIIYLTINKWNN